jgi:glutamate 5-kinase
LFDLNGVEFARGLSDYSSAESVRLVGCKSIEIEKILGYHYGDVIVHRDNLVLL